MLRFQFTAPSHLVFLIHVIYNPISPGEKIYSYLERSPKPRYVLIINNYLFHLCGTLKNSRQAFCIKSLLIIHFPDEISFILFPRVSLLYHLPPLADLKPRASLSNLTSEYFLCIQVVWHNSLLTTNLKRLSSR